MMISPAMLGTGEISILFHTHMQYLNSLSEMFYEICWVVYQAPQKFVSGFYFHRLIL